MNIKNKTDNFLVTSKNSEDTTEIPSRVASIDDTYSHYLSAKERKKIVIVA